MPTILSVAGLQTPKSHKLDGIDLSPVIFQEGSLPKRPLFWFSLSNGGYRHEAMREGDWKLIAGVGKPGVKPGTYKESVSLYNLRNDLSENHNIANKHPEIAQAMLKKLSQAYVDFSETATPQKGGWLRPYEWKDGDFGRFIQMKQKEWKEQNRGFNGN